MWNICCYSNGDLCSDRYLKKYDTELDSYVPKFADFDAYDTHIEFIKEAISRLEDELDLLKNYPSVVGCFTWEDVFNNEN